MSADCQDKVVALADGCLIIVRIEAMASSYYDLSIFHTTLHEWYNDNKGHIMSNDVKLNHHKIQKLRMIKCWSQEELAAISGLSVRTIQRVEKSGTASLETTKALAAVFSVTPNELQSLQRLEHKTFHFIRQYAWLLFFAGASVFFAMWTVDILIPTLKGADFNQQYEMHNNFRYLDYGGLCFFVGFVLLAINVCAEHISTKGLVKKISNQDSAKQR